MTRQRIYHFRCICDTCKCTAVIETDDPDGYTQAYPAGWMRILPEGASGNAYSDVCAGCYFDVFLKYGHARLIKRH